MMDPPRPKGRARCCVTDEGVGELEQVIAVCCLVCVFFYELEVSRGFGGIAQHHDNRAPPLLRTVAVVVITTRVL